MPQSVPYAILDAFTDTPFAGNPAGVIVFDSAEVGQSLTSDTLQKIASEINAPMTAFLTRSESPSDFAVRWFTPTAEAALCGHATIAAAVMLFAEASSPTLDLITFHATSGASLITKRLDDGKVELALDAPPLSAASASEEALASQVVAEAFGAPVKIKAIVPATYFLLVHIDPEIDLEGSKVDAQAFMKFSNYRINIVTSERPCPSHPGARFVSRVFAPLGGLAEDPVCGTAHTILAQYWSQALGIPSKEIIPCKQVSPRGGVLDLVWDQEVSKVLLRGTAVKTAQGELFV